jgi:hypothetical protein
MIMNNDWIKENGDNWAAGRVECFDSEDSYGYANREYSLIIDQKDWNEFHDYLLSITTDQLKTLEELIDMSTLPIVRF